MSKADAAISTVAVIGAGHAGQLFAQRCLEAGLTVVLEDVMPATLRSARQALEPLVMSSARGRLTTVLTVEDAVRDADLAIDFVPDELESKLEIFSMVDRMAPPRTILCTPTSTLSITDLASCTYRPERCFALHDLTRSLGSSHNEVSLVYAVGADVAAQDALQELLERLNLRCSAALDTEMPQLTRNA